MIEDEPEVFFDLARCIAAAENAARSARRLALENPEQAERHEARATWLDERAAMWRDELKRAAHEELRQQLEDSLALEDKNGTI